MQYNIGRYIVYTYISFIIAARRDFSERQRGLSCRDLKYDGFHSGEISAGSIFKL